MTHLSHPRLADHAIVLQRGDDIQIGVTPEHSLVIEAPPHGLGELLGRLDGRHSVRTLQQHAEEILGLPDWPELLRTLRRHRLLVGPSRAHKRHRVQVVTTSWWGIEVAQQLLAAEISQVWLVVLDDDPALSQRARALAAEYRDRLYIHRAWSAPESDHVVTIVDTGTVETDRAITAALANQDITHLLVRPTTEGIVLGPLVVPGEAPCITCFDLQARQQDPHWPQVLLQLTRVRLSSPRIALQWAASTAVTELLGFLNTRQSSLLGHTATVRAPQWTPHWRQWRPHPSCLCHWDGRDVNVLSAVA